jgi:hypothetical protein
MASHICGTSPSVPMIVKYLSPKSLASGRRTEITWLCQTKTRSWMAPRGLTPWKAGDRPPWQTLRRLLPNCRIGRAVGRSPGRTSFGFRQRSVAPRCRHPRHLAPGRSVLVGLERMAPAARRRRARCKDVGQTRTQARGANPMATELAQAKQENARLLRRLEHAEAIIPIQKKRQPCWGCRRRHPTATTRHDRCRRCAGADARSHRRCAALNLSRATVYRQRWHLARPRALPPPAEAAPRPLRCRTSSRAGPSARAALRRSDTRRNLCLPARRGHLPLLDPHHVPHSGPKPGSP